MNPNATSEMFEEVKLLLKEINDKINEKQADTLDENDIANMTMKYISGVDQLNIEKMLEDIESKLDKTQKTVIYNVSELKNIIRENTNHNHRHIFDIKSSKTFIIIALLPLLFLGIFMYINNLTNEKNRFKNNDIKYRYIKMVGGASRADLYVLDSIFNDESNKEIQEKHRTQVVDFETKVQQRAEELEQANLKEEQAKKLLNESKQIRKR